jgi:hypothetical protein
MGGIGALFASRLEHAEGSAALEQFVEQHLSASPDKTRSRNSPNTE